MSNEYKPVGRLHDQSHGAGTVAKIPMTLTAVLTIRTAEANGHDGAQIARLAESIALENDCASVESWHVDDAITQIVAGLEPDDDCFQ